MPPPATVESLTKPLSALLLTATKPLAASPLATSQSASEPNATLPSVSSTPATLNLSGNIISATCFTPYEFAYRRQTTTADAWTLTPRRGASALIDSLKHISSGEGGWGHTIVGWTGEIEELSANVETSDRSHMMNARTLSSEIGVPKAPPPVPYFGDTTDRMHMKGDYSKPVEEQKPLLTREQREELQRVLDERAPQAGWKKVVPVWLGDEEEGGLPLVEEGRWREYAEKVLWPTFHYIVPQTFSPAEGSTLEERSWWKDYLRFNNAFADAIVEIYKPGDIVWIHDYHLLVLPEILRQRLGRDVYIGLFIHAPWPSSEIFRIISHRNHLIEGMLASNMVAFQSETYKDHFVSCCKRIMSYTETLDEDGKATGVDTYGAHCAVIVSPIGVDLQKVTAAVNNPGVEENMAKIKAGYGDKKIIVGRDRLDGVRGVLQKLKAFERFLETNPQWFDKVVLIQITSPSHLIESPSIESRVSELVSQINGRFGNLHYTPVQHYPQYLQPQEYYALLRVADLGLITSVRDGMNTASLEYIICQKDTHGPVILSEFTGTAESLSDAIVVNPTNTAQVAEKIAQCLDFTPQQRRKHYERLWNFVSNNTAQAWNARFLSKLFLELQRDRENPNTPAVDTQSLLAAYKSAKKRLFMFDYDGTLTPIVQDPQMAIPADRVVRTLKRLAQDPANSVWIISGRDTEFLSQWLGHIEELGLSAEHGCFMREPKSTVWRNLADDMDMGWRAITDSVFRKYTEKTAGSFIEHKSIAVTWHYRRAELGLGKFMAEQCRREMETELMNWPVEVMEGKANLEVRPMALNKGEIVRQLTARDEFEFVFCAGDDRTDEDMFEVLKNADGNGVFTVTVGPSSKVTKADWHLMEPSNVVDVVGLCVGTVDRRDVAGEEQKKVKAKA